MHPFFQGRHYVEAVKKCKFHFLRVLYTARSSGGPAPQTSSPRRRRKSVDTYPLATPFDCVAIAPCCFAERKAVLSHALATLTALTRARAKPQRELLAALTRCNVRESAEEFEQRIFFHSEDRPHTRR